MKVLYIHQFFTTPQGSTGTRSYEMAQALIRAGHQVTMVCSTHAIGKSGLDGPFVKGVRRGDVDGIDVVEFQSEYSNHLSVAKRAYWFLRYALGSIRTAVREPHDLLFATTVPLTAALPGIWVKLIRRRKRPFVFEVRDPWPEVPRAMGMKNPLVLGALEYLETLAYRAADGWVALAPGIVDSFARKGVPREKVALVPNGADLDVFKPSTQKGIDIDGIVPGEVVFAFTGAHGIANGLDQVVEAAHVLQERGESGIRIWLVGDGKAKPALVEKAQALGLRNLTFTPPMPKAKLAELLPRVDCGLMILDDVPVFRWASSPNKFFDYICAGLPVIVNHPGWVASMVDEHRCGFYAEPKSAESLAGAMIAIRDSSDRAGMGARARTLAETQFARPMLSKRWVEYLESFVPGSGR